jgi:predicted Zn-dependent protease
VAQLQQALAIRPQLLEIRRDLVRLGLGRLEPDELEAIITEGARQEPLNPFWPQVRGHLELARNQPHSAEVFYRQALQLLPGAAELRFGLAESLIAQDRKPEASAIYRALSSDPKLPAEERARARQALSQLGGR